MKMLRLMTTIAHELLLNPTSIVSVVDNFNGLHISYITVLAPNSSQPRVFSVPHTIKEIEEKLAHTPTKMLRLPVPPNDELLLNTDFIVSAENVYNQKTDSNSTIITLSCPFTENLFSFHPSFGEMRLSAIAAKTKLLTYYIPGNIDLIEEAFSKII